MAQTERDEVVDPRRVLRRLGEAARASTDETTQAIQVAKDALARERAARRPLLNGGNDVRT